MTDKRFVDYFDKDHNYIIQDLQNEDEYQVGFVNCDEDIFLELINHLNDENEQLKSENDWLKSIHFANDVLKENKELKQTVHRLKENIDELMQLDIEEELLKENERLRKAVDNCQFRTLDLLDYIKEKETVTHQDIKDWWNSEVIE